MIHNTNYLRWDWLNTKIELFAFGLAFAHTELTEEQKNTAVFLGWKNNSPDNTYASKPFDLISLILILMSARASLFQDRAKK